MADIGEDVKEYEFVPLEAPAEEPVTVPVEPIPEKEDVPV